MERKRLSFRAMQKMKPQDIRDLEPIQFQYFRAKDIAQLSDEQLFALHPEQIKALKPISFSQVDPKKLWHLLTLLERQVPDELDLWTETVTDRNGEEKEKEFYGAKETIRRAIVKAEKVFKQKAEKEALQEDDGMVTPEDMDASVVVARLNITKRFLYILGLERKPAEFKMDKLLGKYVVNKQSLIDFLNRQAKPAAVLGENGKPLLQPEEYEKPEKDRDLTNYVPRELEPLTDVPVFYPIEHFAKQMRMDHRSFVRLCNQGYFDCYRIGSVFRMTEEHYLKNVERLKNAPRVKRVGRKSALEA